MAVRQLFETTSNIVMRIVITSPPRSTRRSDALFSGDREQPGSVGHSFTHDGANQ